MTTNNDSFVPANYEPPTTGGNYMKFADGENQFRILSKPILGWMDWKDKKPLRFAIGEKPAAPIDPAKPVRHFWAMKVYNYATKTMQVLEITQATIQEAITAYSRDPQWGNPFKYDFKIIRKGVKMDTEYQVLGMPPRELGAEARAAFVKTPIHLEALYIGGDPFAVPGAAQPVKQAPPPPPPPVAQVTYTPAIPPTDDMPF